MLGRRKLRVVTDFLAILNLVLMQSPENADLVEQIVLGLSASGNFFIFLRIMDYFVTNGLLYDII